MWFDAVCINQLDHDEKLLQTQQIDLVHSRAQGDACLGQDTESPFKDTTQSIFEIPAVVALQHATSCAVAERVLDSSGDWTSSWFGGSS
jgi:hypothetical protein